MIRAKGRRPLTCHHEAGHALVRWYFGHQTDRAIVLTVEQVRAGVRLENRRGVPVVGCEGMVDAYSICGYPYGPARVQIDPEAAPEMLKGWGVGRDIALIECYAGFYAEAAYRRCSVIASILAGGGKDMEDARNILGGWDLDEDERNAVVLSAQDRAAALVRSKMGSAAIQAVAAALLDRGEIDGDEIAALCRPAYGGQECAFGAWSDHWPPTLAQIRSGHVPERPAPSQASA